MRAAFVDSSCLIAIALGERGGKRLATLLGEFDVLLVSSLLEAELRCALAREKVDADPAPLLRPLSWVSPDRPLGPELERVLSAGYVRGADAWHLACALYVEPEPRELTFLTLDVRQRRLAKALGFPVA